MIMKLFQIFNVSKCLYRKCYHTMYIYIEVVMLLVDNYSILNLLLNFLIKFLTVLVVAFGFFSYIKLLSEVYDKAINTWPFPYQPGYHPSTHISASTPSRADMGVSG